MIDVKMTTLDRLIAWASPSRGLDRMRARSGIAMIGGGYEGGRRDKRSLRSWRPSSGSADSDVLPDLQSLRARSRDMLRNEPVAVGAVSTVATNVVGDGLRVQSTIDAELLNLSPESASMWQRQAEREFALFCHGVDLTGVQSFEELQRMVFRSVLESGDCFALRRFKRRPGLVYGTALQIFEADQISNPGFHRDTEKVAGGVVLDSDNRPIGYHISSHHPGDIVKSATARRWQMVPASDNQGRPVVIHLFDRTRPGQTRGVPYLAPVIEDLKQFGRFTNAEIDAAVVNAFFAVWIKSPDAGGTAPVVGVAEPDDTDGRDINLEAGIVQELAPGEEPVSIAPGRPNPQFDPFVTAFLRHIGVALELPFELLVKHFTASYSASRAALEMAWQYFRRRRTWLIRHFCQPVYVMCLDEAVASGRLPAPGFFDDPLMREAWSGAEWIGPARMSLDPKKEAEADKIDLGMGTKTRRQIMLERTGGDFDGKTAQLKHESEIRAAAGLVDDKPAAVLPVPIDQGDDDA